MGRDNRLSRVVLSRYCISIYTYSTDIRLRDEEDEMPAGECGVRGTCSLIFAYAIGTVQATRLAMRSNGAFFVIVTLAELWHFAHNLHIHVFFVSIGLQFILQTLTYSFLSRTTHRSTSRRSAPPLIPRASLGLPRNQLPHQPAPLAYPRRPLIRWRSSRQRRRRGGEVNPFRRASSLTQKRAPAQQ